MRMSVISFTEKGMRLSERLAGLWQGGEMRIFTKCGAAKGATGERGGATFVGQDVGSWAGEQMREGNALLFIGACGIAVRSIAPHLEGKIKDVPVLVMDELGRHVIPILSGHFGGANALARKVAAAVGAEAAITTATDLNGKFAIDLFAKENGLAIRNPEGIARVSAKILSGCTVTVSVDPGRLRGAGGKEGLGLPEGVLLAPYPPDGSADVIIGPPVELAEAGENLLEGARLAPYPPDRPADIVIEPPVGLAVAGDGLPEGVRLVPYPPDGSADVVIGSPVDFAVAGDGLPRTQEDSAGPLLLIPREYAVGVGCKKGKDARQIEDFLRKVLEQAGIFEDQVFALATIDRKKEEPGLLGWAKKRGIPIFAYSAGQLQELEGDFHASAFVLGQTGTDNVCERAAALACASGGELVLPKLVGDGMTAAIAKRDWSVSFEDAAGSTGEATGVVLTGTSEDTARDSSGSTGEAAGVALGDASKRAAPEAAGATGDAEEAAGSLGEGVAEISIVGIGPGGERGMTREAIEVLGDAEVIVGYPVYLDLLRDRFPGKEYFSTPMRREEERCRFCFQAAAAGRRVALACSGDAGIYGLASLMHEIGEEYPKIGLRVVAGVTAASSGAAVLGAPLGHDFCTISLSDCLTPWETIERRLAAAAEGDFVIVLYNPSSRRRKDYLAKACGILLCHMEPERPCGYVENIGRKGEKAEVCTLLELRDVEANMFTTVFIGNKGTRIIHGKLVTRRGYPIGKNIDIRGDS